MWRAALDGRLRVGAAPVVCMPGDGALDGAALLAGARAWAAWLRALGVRAGDRIVCALPPGPGFVMVLLAALGEGLTFVPVPASADVDPLLDAVDARVAVVGAGVRGGAGVAVAARDGGPSDGSPNDAPFGGAPACLRAARTAPTPGVRFLLQTSGTTGAPRRVALSDANVGAVLASHAPHLALAGAVVLSVLPWHHAFGLVLELLPALLGGATLVRDASGGRDADAMLAVDAARRVTHLHAVPHTARLLAERDEGRALLARLRAGLVGGAPVDPGLAAHLAGTRVRVGYGQTEASPGVSLGEPGAWRAGALGRPLGCAVRLDDDGVLAFRGPNACLGFWDEGVLNEGVLTTLAPDRWVRTGDLARAEPDGSYTFEGRAAESFKLANGRFVAALAVERAACARWPALTDALLSSPDGRTFVLAVSVADMAGAAADGAVPAAADIAPMLGPLATRPLRVVRVAPGTWVRTPKGDLDRRFPVGRAG